MITERQDPSDLYDFVEVTPEDHDRLVEFISSEFIQIEPHQKAKKVSPEDVRYMYKWVVGRAIHFPYSLKIVEKSTGKWVGVRLLSVEDRDKSLYWEPFKLQIHKLSLKALSLCDDLEKSEGLFWKTIDNGVNKIIRRDLTFVLPEHQRKGIARKMVTFRLNYDELRAQGIQGLVSDASSVANQKLLKSEGYEQLALCKSKHQLHDGSQGIRILFKDIRKP